MLFWYGIVNCELFFVQYIGTVKRENADKR